VLSPPHEQHRQDAVPEGEHRQVGGHRERGEVPRLVAAEELPLAEGEEHRVQRREQPGQLGHEHFRS
jgi:hypothetical protein